MPKITKTTVDGHKPTGKDQWIWDSEVPVFGLRCKPGGRNTGVACWRNHEGTWHLSS